MPPPAARQPAERKQAPSRLALTHSSTEAGRAPSRSSSSASLAESVGAGESSHVNGLAGFGHSTSSVSGSYAKPPRVAMGKKPLGGGHGSSSSGMGPAGGTGGLSSSSSNGGRLHSSSVAGGGAMRPGRKSVAGVPMRVPGTGGNGPGLLYDGGPGTGAATTAPGEPEGLKAGLNTQAATAPAAFHAYMPFSTTGFSVEGASSCHLVKR